MAALFNYNTMCDVDPASGIVHNVMTQQVITDDEGNTVGFRYFDAATGQPYELVGEASDCSVTRGPEILVLCEHKPDGSTVQFIRRFTELDSGITLVGDSDLNGDQSYDVDPESTVSLCFDDPCDPIAALGTCLADGTPIAVLLKQDCATASSELEGYVNLLTGAFTAGPLPDGTQPCGRPSVQVVGPLCVTVGDVVTATVAIQYRYGPDGEVVSTALVDTVTGAVYVPPAGAVVGACLAPPVVVPPFPDVPAAADALMLCDDNGPFVRDFSRLDGIVTAVRDYTLAGAPYAPVGSVGLCEPDQPMPPAAGPISVGDVCLSSGNPGAVLHARATAAGQS